MFSSIDAMRITRASYRQVDHFCHMGYLGTRFRDGPTSGYPRQFDLEALVRLRLALLCPRESRRRLSDWLDGIGFVPRTGWVVITPDYVGDALGHGGGAEVGTWMSVHLIRWRLRAAIGGHQDQDDVQDEEVHKEIGHVAG